MRFRPGRIARQHRLHRATVAIALILNQLVLATGLPLPAVASAAAKDKSKPFPCMDRPCGCMNAEQCWSHCCCFTMREKLAWAEEHGVEPPEFVREAAAKEAAEMSTAHHGDGDSCDVEHTRQCDADGGCCACCAHHAALLRLPTAEPTAPAHRANSVSAPMIQRSTIQKPVEGSRWTIWIVALGCQGHGILESLLATPSLPAILPVFFGDAPRSLDRPSGAGPGTTAVVFFSPPVPPPRLLARGV
jgi:hypothetical protein